MAGKPVAGLAAKSTPDTYHTKAKAKGPKPGGLTSMKDAMTVAQRAKAGGKQFKEGETPDVARMLPVRPQTFVRRGFVGQ